LETKDEKDMKDTKTNVPKRSLQSTHYISNLRVPEATLLPSTRLSGEPDVDDTIILFAYNRLYQLSVLDYEKLHQKLESFGFDAYHAVRVLIKFWENHNQVDERHHPVEMFTIQSHKTAKDLYDLMNECSSHLKSKHKKVSDYRLVANDFWYVEWAHHTPVHKIPGAGNSVLTLFAIPAAADLYVLKNVKDNAMNVNQVVLPQNRPVYNLVPLNRVPVVHDPPAQQPVVREQWVDPPSPLGNIVDQYDV
jgi:hypothetical protein